MIRNQAEELLIQMETDMVAAQKRGDYAAVANVLAEDFHEIDSHGVLSSKAEILEAIRAAPLTDYSFEGFRLQPIGDDCVIVIYIATTRRTINGHERARRAHRSSTWVKRSGSWRMVFHQGTPLP